MKTPICPILLFFKGDEYKCNPLNCNYDRKTKTCTMKCLKYQEKFFEKNNLTNKTKRV